MKQSVYGIDIGNPRAGITMDLAEWRLSALASAVRDHEALGRRRPLGVRSEDAELYRRLREICGASSR